MAELDAELEAAHGMSLGEYAVLVELSEAPEQRLRMTDLAGRLHLSPSGLTSRFDRLGRQGLVTREACPTDRRAVYAGLTPAGLQRLEDAAPDHVAGVRRLLIDRLDEAQLDQLRGPRDAAVDLRRTRRLTARRLGLSPVRPRSRSFFLWGGGGGGGFFKKKKKKKKPC